MFLLRPLLLMTQAAQLTEAAKPTEAPQTTDSTQPAEAGPATDEDNFGLESLFQDPIDIVYPFGDVVLHVVDDKNLESRFLVSTDLLAQTCPFLDRLLKGDFAEGQKDRRSAAERIEVTIREDRAAVQTLCYLIHHKRLNDELKMSPSMILQYAILVDKYQCVDQLRLPNEGLVQAQVRALKTSDWRQRKDLCNLMAATYILDLPAIFRKLTRKLVYVGDSNINWTCFDDDCWDHLPMTLLASLNAQVNTAQKTLAHHVGVLVSEFSKTAKICDKDDLVSDFVERLTNACLLPTNFDSPEYPIKVLAQKLEDIDVPALLSDSGVCHCSEVPIIGTVRSSDGTKHSKFCYRPKLDQANPVVITQRHAQRAARNVREVCVGLCLDCVKTPGSQFRHTCRVAHPQPWIQHAREHHDSGRELDLDVFKRDRKANGPPDNAGNNPIDRAGFYMRLLHDYPRPAFWRDTW
ncbi:hypothetical protein PRZ48_013148 [Zasmidium cellare]|uniref:BTB domain-containing protein n=1 Tax=Zasmidium cellare TaxID=395010 RepID=A0ABR0E3N7_ZASCE|nr:hypothetical protein PRZ48_013148 [Zasmidium cellare]